MKKSGVNNTKSWGYIGLGISGIGLVFFSVFVFFGSRHIGSVRMFRKFGLVISVWVTKLGTKIISDPIWLWFIS